MPFGPWPGQPGGGGGGFPGFGAAPPAVATASSSGASGLASRSDHTHALDLVTYTPSVAGMQASGMVVQTFAAGSAAPTVVTATANRVLFGATSGGLPTTSASFMFLASFPLFGVSSPGSTATPTTMPACQINAIDELGFNASFRATASFAAPASSAAFTFSRSRGTFAAPTAVANDDLLAATYYLAHDGTGYRVPWIVAMRVDHSAAVAPNVVPSNLIFCFNNTPGLSTDVSQIQAQITYAGDFVWGERAIAPGAVRGFVYLRSTAGIPVGVPVPPTDTVGTATDAQPFVYDSTDNRLYTFFGAAWHFAQFPDFAPTFNSVTAQAATALTLVGNATSTWQTSAGGIVIRANTAGVLGTTSTQVTFSTGTDITFVGNVVGAAGLGSLGTLASPWQAFATSYKVSAGGVQVADFQSGGLSLSAAGSQSVSKANGTLFVQTTDADDVVFRTNSTESFRVDNATTVLSWRTGAGLTAAGAVAVTITNAPAGVGAAPAEYLKVLGTGGATRYIPLLG